MLPKTKINIRGNRMVGAGLTQYKSSSKAQSNSSDIIANFHSSSSMSKLDLAKTGGKLRELLSNG